MAPSAKSPPASSCARPASAAAPSSDLVHLLDRQRRTTLSFQNAEGVCDPACRPRRLHFDPSIRKFVHGDLLAGMHSKMFEYVPAQGDLAFGGDRKCCHKRP